MTKEELSWKEKVFEMLDKNGMTSLVSNYPSAKLSWVLEWLDKQDQTVEFKKYYKEFCEFHFKD